MDNDTRWGTLEGSVTTHTAPDGRGRTVFTLGGMTPDLQSCAIRVEIVSARLERPGVFARVANDLVKDLERYGIA